MTMKTSDMFTRPVGGGGQNGSLTTLQEPYSQFSEEGNETLTSPVLENV